LKIWSNSRLFWLHPVWWLWTFLLVGVSAKVGCCNVVAVERRRRRVLKDRITSEIVAVNDTWK
jgi:hypothetical protein